MNITNGNKNTGWQRVLLIIIPYIFIVGFFQFIGVLIAKVNLNNYKPNAITSEQNLIISLFDSLGIFLLLWLCMKFIDKEKFIKLGFYRKNKLYDFISGLLIGVLIMALGFFLLKIINQIKFEQFNFDFFELIISICFYSLVALAEETLFRGYILRNLMYSFNKYIALIVSSILFSLIHGANPNMDWFSFLDLFLGGVLLGTSYIYTKNLWFPIALHFSWNFFQSLFGFNVSGQDFYSLIEITIIEKNILNGGDFGFEGSIFSTIFQIICVILIHNYYSKIEINN